MMAAHNFLAYFCGVLLKLVSVQPTGLFVLLFLNKRGSKRPPIVICHSRKVYEGERKLKKHNIEA
jgi:hypothetical protein